MTPEAQRRIDQWWCTVMGANPSQLWASVTISTHAASSPLADYPGLYVAWRGSGVHVSAPASALPALESLAGMGIDDLQHLKTWTRIARTLEWRVVGPATHTYCDVDPGVPDDVEVAARLDLDALRSLVPRADWEESGFADDPPLAWTIRDGDDVLAAANLNPWGHKLGDTGVLVAPAHRGRGLAARVGAAAASHAVSTSGMVRWCAQTSNVASLAAARRVGFEPWLTQLAVRA